MGLLNGRLVDAIAWTLPMRDRTKVEVIHNASVMGAVASCGLQLYSFGQTVSIPLWNEKWEPDSFHEKIRVNKAVRSYDQSLLFPTLLLTAVQCTIDNMLRLEQRGTCGMWILRGADTQQQMGFVAYYLQGTIFIAFLAGLRKGATVVLSLVAVPPLPWRRSMS